MSKSIDYVPFGEESNKRAAAVEFAKTVNSIFFFYLSEEASSISDENGEPDFQNYEALDELSDSMWAATCASMSALSMNMLGKTDDGQIIVSIKPCESVKQFLMTEDIGLDDDIYYEDIFDEIGEDSGFGKHDDKIVGI